MINPYFIGIAGGSASGKTTILSTLLKKYDRSEVMLISQDNYYFPRSEQESDDNGVINFDLPTAIDTAHFLRDLKDVKAGKSILKQEYTFNNPDHTPAMIEVVPAPVMLIEGLFVFHYTEIDKLFDYRLYVDCDPEDRLQRRIARDFEERGYPESDVRYRWENHVRPADIAFLEPHKQRADLVLNNTIDCLPQIHLLTEIIDSRLTSLSK